MKHRSIGIVLAACLAVAAIGVGVAVAGSPFEEGSAKERSFRKAISDNTPRDVILLIGDGMGTQEITAARYYQGVSKPLNVDRLPVTGFATTYSVKPGAAAPYLPDFAPDSAPTASAWATGQKTIDGRISQGPSTGDKVPGENLKTILEIMQEQGKKVGNVSTAEITDATPAVLAAHISQRGCQGPANMANCDSETKAKGGLGSIAEQQVDHKVDVLLGGGRARFEQAITGGPDAGGNVIQSAEKQGYKYVTNATDLAAYNNKNKPILGLFNSGNMSLEWSGPAATLGKGNSPVPCTEGQRPANEPGLKEMTEKAIQLLQNQKGFFLQVEGASIDKQDHAANACGQLGETVAFDEAIGAALDYQDTHPDTLILVSADHAHTSQIVNEDATGTGIPTGYNTNLTTKEGATMSLTYGTSGYGGEGKAPVASASTLSQQHTGAVVPVWAGGPRALKALGTNDQTDLFEVLGG